MCRLHVRQCCPDHQRRASGVAVLIVGIPALLFTLVAAFSGAPAILLLLPLAVLLVVPAVGTLQVAGDGIDYQVLAPPRKLMVFGTIAIGTALIFAVKAYLWLLL